MKRSLINCLAVLLIGVPAAVAMWASVPLQDLLKETDVIVVARLSGVREITRERVDYGFGTLAVTEVIRGSAKAGDKLRLEWSNVSGLICPRLELSPCEGKTMIWLLQTSTNGAVRVDCPGRVFRLEGRSQLDVLLEKRR
jgi:hypothetical protein